MRRRRSMRAARAPSPRADSLLASTTSGAAAASRTSRSSETTRTFIWMGARPTCHGRAGSRRKGERWRGRADLSGAYVMIRLTSLTAALPRAASNWAAARTRPAARPGVCTVAQRASDLSNTTPDRRSARVPCGMSHFHSTVPLAEHLWREKMHFVEWKQYSSHIFSLIFSWPRLSNVIRGGCDARNVEPELAWRRRWLHRCCLSRQLPRVSHMLKLAHSLLQPLPFGALGLQGPAQLVELQAAHVIVLAQMAAQEADGIVWLLIDNGRHRLRKPCFDGFVMLRDVGVILGRHGSATWETAATESCWCWCVPARGRRKERNDPSRCRREHGCKADSQLEKFTCAVHSSVLRKFGSPGMPNYYTAGTTHLTSAVAWRLIHVEGSRARVAALVAALGPGARTHALARWLAPSPSFACRFLSRACLPLVAPPQGRLD